MHGTNICSEHGYVMGGCRCLDRGTKINRKPCDGKCDERREKAALVDGRVFTWEEPKLGE